VGLDLKAGKAGNGNFWRCCASIRFSRASSAAVPSPISSCAARERKSRRRPAARAHRSHDVFAQAKRRNDKAERQPGRHFWKAFEHHATIRRERGQRRLVVKKSINGVFDDGEIELLDTRQESGAARTASSCPADFDDGLKRTAPTNALRDGPSARRPDERHVHPLQAAPRDAEPAAMPLMNG